MAEVSKARPLCEKRTTNAEAVGGWERATKAKEGTVVVEAGKNGIFRMLNILFTDSYRQAGKESEQQSSRENLSARTVGSPDPYWKSVLHALVDPKHDMSVFVNLAALFTLL